MAIRLLYKITEKGFKSNFLRDTSLQHEKSRSSGSPNRKSRLQTWWFWNTLYIIFLKLPQMFSEKLRECSKLHLFSQILAYWKLKWNVKVILKRQYWPNFYYFPCCHRFVSYHRISRRKRKHKCKVRMRVRVLGSTIIIAMSARYVTVRRRIRKPNRLHHLARIRLWLYLSSPHDNYVYLIAKRRESADNLRWKMSLYPRSSCTVRWWWFISRHRSLRRDGFIRRLRMTLASSVTMTASRPFASCLGGGIARDDFTAARNGRVFEYPRRRRAHFSRPACRYEESDNYAPAAASRSTTPRLT